MPDCPDAISDVQWGAVNYLQYLQEHLGLMGGLVKDADNPVPVVGRVHYEEGKTTSPATCRGLSCWPVLLLLTNCTRASSNNRLLQCFLRPWR